MEWTCTQKSKVLLSGRKFLFLDSRIFRYTFACVRSDGAHTTMTIEAGPDDDRAATFAQLQCEGEAREPQ